MSEERFNELHEDLSREDILNQYYYAYLTNKKLCKRIDKAIEYIEELISDTKGTLNDMRYCDKRVNITQFVEDLEDDIKHYEYAIGILKGEEDE